MLIHGRFMTGVLFLLMAAQASAQYAGTPGDIPPIPDSYLLEVDSIPPYSCLESVPDAPDWLADSLVTCGEDKIVWSSDGTCVFRLEKSCSIVYVFQGEWGVNLQECFNVASVSQLSPSSEFYAVGADGTGTSRGPVYVIDLETGIKYVTTIADVWWCSDWIDGDYLILDTIGNSPESLALWSKGDTTSMPWINQTYLTEAEGRSGNLAVYHGGRTWMILPEDRYYSYTVIGAPWRLEDEIVFDVAASSNVIPSIAGIESPAEFSPWIESVGGYEIAFPEFGFRVFVDTVTGSIEEIRKMNAVMVVEGFLNSMTAGDYYGMLDYVTIEARSSITESQGEEVRNTLHLYSDLQYRILEVAEEVDEAVITAEIILPGYADVIQFTLVLENHRWLLESI